MTNQVGIDMNSDSDSDDLLQYNPNRLLDTLIENLRLKNDDRPSNQYANYLLIDFDFSYYGSS